MRKMILENKRITFIFLAAAFILLIPLLAMQFTDEVDWSLFDFVVAGALLFSAGFVIEFMVRNRDIKYRVIGAGLLLSLLLIWIELAVGIFGTPFAGS